MCQGADNRGGLWISYNVSMVTVPRLRRECEYGECYQGYGDAHTPLKRLSQSYIAISSTVNYNPVLFSHNSSQ